MISSSLSFYFLNKKVMVIICNSLDKDIGKKDEIRATRENFAQF
jgi:hypothetical protein